MPHYTTTQGVPITLGKSFGSGGEGAVFEVIGHPNMVAKIYHSQRLNASLETKVHAMVATPPNDITRATVNHVSIAWPEAVLLNGTSFAGYLMPKIPKSDNLYALLQPQQRAQKHPSLNHRHLYRSARNLAFAMDAIHQKGYVVGDVNFRNALFNDRALITLVDCDSMQVTDAQNKIHRCLVGIPEYTAPELQKKDLATINRTINHDAFGLAILIFQLLMQGFHPFAGKPLPGAPDVEQVHVYCITQNIFPYVSNNVFAPPKAAPPIGALPAALQNLLREAFLTTIRPTPKQWADTLGMIESRLVRCTNNHEHWYPSDGACVICEVDYNVGRRTRPASAPTQPTTQIPLPTPPSPPLPPSITRPTQSTPPITPPPITRPTQSTAPVPVAPTAQNGSMPLSTMQFPLRYVVWTLIIVLAWATYMTATPVPTPINDTGAVTEQVRTQLPTPWPTQPLSTATVAIATRTPSVKRPTKTHAPIPHLAISKIDGNDTPDCVSMQILGIDAANFALLPEGIDTTPAHFDGAGNARICGEWLVEKTIMMRIYDTNGHEVIGGRAPAHGGDILMGTWKNQ